MASVGHFFQRSCSSNCKAFDNQAAIGRRAVQQNNSRGHVFKKGMTTTFALAGVTGTVYIGQRIVRHERFLSSPLEATRSVLRQLFGSNANNARPKQLKEGLSQAHKALVDEQASSDKGKLYFAYGSNLNPKQMKQRCPNSTALGAATLQDHELVFVGHSRHWNGAVADIRPKSGSTVEGIVYRVNADDISILDQKEGMKYTRNLSKYNPFKVKMNHTGQELPVISYLRKERNEERKQPSQLYKRAIVNGAQGKDLDGNAVAKAPQLSEHYIKQLNTIPVLSTD
jgi:cation transport regulator ChaC